MDSRQKAIILSYHQPPNLTYLVDALNKYGYNVALMVTGRGPNYALSDSSYERMGAQIAGVLNVYDFPVLAVKNVTQAKRFIMAADADLGFCIGFPYRITKDLLSTRTTFVNFHPGPLPLLAGGMPFIWPILRPDVCPLEDYRPTAHYMTPVVDEGRIILAPKIQLPEGVDASNVTATQIQAATVQAMLHSVDEVVKLVKNGNEGADPAPLPDGLDKYMARRPSDEERTITKEMTVEQADRIWRARHGPQNPFFRNEQGLFRVVAFRRIDDKATEATKVRRQPGGAYRAGTRLVQKLSDGCLELDVRKL